MALALAAFPLLAHAQQTLGGPAADANGPGTPYAITTPPPPASQRPPRMPSELAETAMVSYGDYRVFGATARCNVYTAGIEYDRHTWGYHYKARVDYVVEVLPFVILSEPAAADFWGNPQSPNQQILHGVGISPFGFRFLWREGTHIKPYMTGKAGGIVFNKKAMSPNSSYANFNFQGDFGLEIPLRGRAQLRIVPLEYFHVSNGYLAASNPGMDELAIKFGISYNLGTPHSR